MEPVTTITTAWGLAKAAGEISKKLGDVYKNLKDRDAKQQVDELLDKMRDLKQSASELEDENRDLRAKLRFKGDDFEFRTPFWYDKTKPRQALCPKCFAQNIAAPMGEPGISCTPSYRRCLVCGQAFEVQHRPLQSRRPPPRGITGY
jgi:hypothetical protein